MWTTPRPVAQHSRILFPEPESEKRHWFSAARRGRHFIGPSVELRYTKEEPLPVSVQCNVHPWMYAFVLLRSNPYMAKTDEDGRFTIKNLPVGEHVFRVWHERASYLRDISLGSLVTDSKGRTTVTIREGMNELTAVRLPL